MRKVELKEASGVYVVFVGGENTGMDYTKDSINAMLDDLMPDYPSRSRNDLLAELVTKTLAHTSARHPPEGGPLTPEEIAEAIRLVTKSCKRGWFG